MNPYIVAAILAIAGIVMMTYADGFHSHSVIGITLVVASASASALYKTPMLDEKAWLSVSTVSIGGGQSSSSTPDSLIHVFMERALCTGVRSCWNRKGPSPNCPHRVGSMERSRVSWSAEALRVPLTGNKGRSLTPEHHPHTIIPPPPNFTLSTVQSDQYRSPGDSQTQTGPLDRQMEKHDWSLQRTRLHCSRVQCRSFTPLHSTLCIAPGDVLFKLVLGSAKFGEAALFLTIVGGANFVFISFVPVILYFTHVEYFGSPDNIPWAYLCGVAALLLAFNILVNFGIAITYPTLISLGIVLSVPVNAMVDLYTCEINFNTVRLIAVFIICLGFLMLLLPEDWDQCLIQLSTRLRKREQHENPSPPEAGAGSASNWSRRTRTSMSTFTH
ncbi:hypothetical protein NFI96_030823 [Prochilodus magdalenae]|nr:hypothetical protein NFI96_030823 [Prochilodus magdalenae]